MGKKSLTKSTTKKKSTAKKTDETKNTAAKASPKSTKPAAPKKPAAPPKPPAQTKPAAPPKKPTLKSLLNKDFGSWAPDKPYAVPEDKPDAKKFTAPPLIDTTDKAKAKALKELLARQFDLTVVQKSPAPEKTDKAKKAPASEPPQKAPAPEKPAAEAPAAKKETPAPKAPAPAPKKPVPIAELIKRSFDSWQPAHLYVAKIDKDADKKFSAPPTIDTPDPAEAERLRALLARTFDLTVVEKIEPEAPAQKPEVKEAVPAETPVEATAAPAPAEAAPKPEVKAPEEKPTPPPTAPEPAAAPVKPEPSEKPAEKSEAKPVEASEKPAPEAPPEKKPEAAKPEDKKPEVKEPEKKTPAPETLETKPMIEKKPAAPEKPAAPKAVAIKETPKAPAPPAPPTPPPVTKAAPPKEPPINPALAMLVGLVVCLFGLLIIASAMNTGHYYLKTAENGVEIWQGKFSPTGKKLVMTVPGAVIEEPVKSSYSRSEALVPAFNYYIQKAEALSEAKGQMDFESIKSTLYTAMEFAPTGKHKKEVNQRLNKIDFMLLTYKADVAAGKKSVEGYEAALEYLTQAAALGVDTPSATAVLEKKTAEITDALESLKQKLWEQESIAAAAAAAEAEKAAALEKENAATEETPPEAENTPSPEPAATHH